MPEFPAPSVPELSLGALFLKFLRFGMLAFGGPVAQIGMLRHEIIEQERWLDSDRFNRVLAVYQALPGPEATELCVYFGMLSRGRLGGVLAGLAFILPGFLLMVGASALYVALIGSAGWFAAMFVGAQPAVAALIVRGVHRIGAGALKSHMLWAIALLAGVADLIGAPFYVPLIAGALAAWLATRRTPWLAGVLLVAMAASAYLLRSPTPAESTQAVGGSPATLWGMFEMGFRGGIFTFGGAYTAIPFVREDAVIVGGWLTDAQFLDGLAIGGVLPTPLVMFVAFVGYLALGMGGASLAALGMFLPAFSFTLIGHKHLEGLVENPQVHSFLDGIAAAVVGIIAATTLRLLEHSIHGWLTAVIFLAAVALTYLWKSPWSALVAVVGAALIGLATQA